MPSASGLVEQSNIFSAGDPSQFISASRAEVRSEINQKLKKMVEDEIEKNIKSGVYGDFPEEWIDLIHVSVTENGVRVRTQNEAIKAQEEGVDPHQMTYLEGETVPIEEDANGNEQAVFRKCTLQSLMQGKWWHPGLEGKGFIEDAVDTAVNNAGQLVNAAHKPDERHRGKGDQTVAMPGGAGSTNV